MPTAGQKEIFNRPPPNLRKVILATSIAETSITIEDVVYVVDCGKTKMTKFDVQANIATFQPGTHTFLDSNYTKLLYKSR